MDGFNIGSNLFGKLQQSPLIKRVQGLFKPKDEPIPIEEQKELFKQMTPQPTPEPPKWEDIEKMAERVGAPIPQHRYIEFGKDLPTLARNPEVSKFKVSDEVKEAISSAAKKAGIQSSLLYDIALQESSFDPKKINPETKKHYGLFQFDEDTWSDMKKWGYVDKDADRHDPYASAQAAALAIKDGWLNKWDASRDVWGPYYTDEELKDYYRYGI